MRILSAFVLTFIALTGLVLSAC
ncbi:MAG: hypothetical protein K0S29_610, partial [Gammaproteobacteria bacterium]|nr:hypothetical protein [Gammaproteobacteria bacterium]